MRWEVTEQQVVSYTWEVDAETEDEALASGEDGVPDDATERLVESETTARPKSES